MSEASIQKRLSLQTLRTALTHLKEQLDAETPTWKGFFSSRSEGQSLSASAHISDENVLRLALCEMLQARDAVHEDIGKAGFSHKAHRTHESEGFSNKELTDLELLDEEIFREAYEVYLRQHPNLAAWRAYRRTHPGELSKINHAAVDETDEWRAYRGTDAPIEKDDELGWWWYIDQERGRRLSRTLFVWVSVLRTVIGLAVLGIFGFVVLNAAQGSIRGTLDIVDASLRDQSFTVSNIFNDATLALLPIILTQIALFLRVSWWASERVKQTGHLLLVGTADILFRTAHRPSWRRARLVSLLSPSRLFVSGLMTFGLLFVFNLIVESSLRSWTDQAQDAACPAIENAQAAVTMLSGDDALSILTRAGRCHERVGYTEAARSTYQTVLQRDPNCLPALYYLAGLYLDEGRPDIALPLVDRGLESLRFPPQATNRTTCPGPNEDYPAIAYEYQIRLRQVAALLQQGDYNAAFIAASDLYERVERYDGEDPMLFQRSLEELDQEVEAGGLPRIATVELSYHMALTLMLSGRDGLAEQYWREVNSFADTPVESSDSRVLIWKQDAQCFVEAASRPLTAFCLQRQQELMGTEAG